MGAGGAGGDPPHKIANTTQEAMRESPLAPGTALDDAGENRYQDAGDERGAVGRPSSRSQALLGNAGRGKLRFPDRKQRFRGWGSQAALGNRKRGRSRVDKLRASTERGGTVDARSLSTLQSRG
uniref:Uncharacterized protein n=1 Tax=Candidatus Kentrum sp. DK TaxID=2126562 RepID=A0A450SKC9_9GAMM|nr:MAG: hypothetical protein BECKDK2373C_GA0170839_104125 [Candidatus Kentron sp. DK]